MLNWNNSSIFASLIALLIIAPVFAVFYSVSEIGSGNLSGKMYKGYIPGWGNLTGPEALEHMITKAGEVEGGFDPNTGMDYTQLISKFAMGAVFYNKLDSYLL